MLLPLANFFDLLFTIVMIYVVPKLNSKLLGKTTDYTRLWYTLLNYKVKARLSVSLLFCLCKIHIVSWYLTFIRGTSLCIASCLDNCCNRLAFIKSHSNSLLKSSTDHYFTIISHKYILLLYNFFHKVAKYSQLRIKEGSWETNKPTYLRFIKAQRSGVRVWERENKKKRKEKERKGKAYHSPGQLSRFACCLPQRLIPPHSLSVSMSLPATFPFHILSFFRMLVLPFRSSFPSRFCAYNFSRFPANAAQKFS